MKTDSRSKVLDAIYILNEILNSLIAGTMVFRSYQKKFNAGKFSKGGIVAVQNMCISHLILGLSKLTEFQELYHELVPETMKDEFKTLIKKLNKSEVKELRNTVYAHVKDRRLGRSKTQFEVVDLLNRLSNDKPNEFLDWLNNTYDYSYPNTVSSIVEELRNYLIKEYDLKKEEVFFR